MVSFWNAVIASSVNFTLSIKLLSGWFLLMTGNLIGFCVIPSNYILVVCLLSIKTTFLVFLIVCRGSGTGAAQDSSLCRRASSSRRFEGVWYIHLHGQAVKQGCCLILQDEDTTILRTLPNGSPKHTAWYPGRHVRPFQYYDTSTDVWVL